MTARPPPPSNDGVCGSSSNPVPILPVSIGDSIMPVGRITPYASAPESAPGSTTGFLSQPGFRVPGRYFHSRRIRKEDVRKPWTEKKDPREDWVTIIPCVGLLVGLAVCALLVWSGLKSVVNHKYCPVLMEDWSGGFDENIWTREVEVGGFGLVSPIQLRESVCFGNMLSKFAATVNSNTQPTLRRTRTSRMARCISGRPLWTKSSSRLTAPSSISHKWASVLRAFHSTVLLRPTPRTEQ